VKKIILASLAFLLCTNLSSGLASSKQKQIVNFEDEVTSMVDRFISRGGESVDCFARDFVELVDRYSVLDENWIQTFFNVIEGAGDAGEKLLSQVSNLTGLCRYEDYRKFGTTDICLHATMLAIWLALCVKNFGVANVTCFLAMYFVLIPVVFYCGSFCFSSINKSEIEMESFYKNLRSSIISRLNTSSITRGDLLNLVECDYKLGRDGWHKFGRVKLDLVSLREIMRDSEGTNSALEEISKSVKLVLDSAVEGHSLFSRGCLDVRDGVRDGYVQGLYVMGMCLLMSPL
jgi:hypothetical protein